MNLVRVPSRLRLIAAIAATVLAPLVGVLPTATALTSMSTHVTGADISWPECPQTTGIPSRRGEGKPMPAPSARFVMLGLTNGPGFYPNPCLGHQFAWVKRHHTYAAAYAMTTYPSPRQLAQYGARGPHTHQHLFGRLWNAGYAQAGFNVATMKRLGVLSPLVWIDVEPYPVAPWSRGIHDNQAVVAGAVRSYRDAGYRVGFYSTQSLWSDVVGNLRFGYPEWRTAGGTSMSSALSKCSTYPIQGGRAVLAQWWSSAADYDVICPGYGAARTMRHWFHRY